MSAPLHIQGLGAGYRDRAILQGLDLAPLPAGQVVSLVGPNGAGKSTLLRAVAGLIPASGSARLGDVELNALSIRERARHVAYMPQTLPQDVALTVLETVIAALEASPLDGPPRGAAEAAMAVLERVGAADLAGRRLDRLSGGQRQIAALAQAMARQPRVLLLDEPTSALDLRHQLEVLTLARDYARERAAVVVMVLHDLQAAARASDHVVVLAQGRLRVEGPPAQAITPQVLADVWRVRARVEPCARGQLQVMVDAVL
ncbi:MAG: iron ABC transporter [Brevundimonas sp.]|uniref:ABC transporter ATP-binding protein n=1 Tax=Brevundimonas sp. TaxID=1871086 RepID=UPI000DBC077F|nr:ABC transporter ATP-binding protein [Brevundimonas sp.]PZU60059.1 MAG: iron ABC transporter [Brevundimonas sp.]